MIEHRPWTPPEDAERVVLFDDDGSLTVPEG